MDIYSDFGIDLVNTSTGDFDTVNGQLETQQRIIRRLLTTPGSYKEHPEYGAGLGAYIGQLMSPSVIDKIKGVIRAQLYLEDAVSKGTPPVITVYQNPSVLNNLQIGITYYEANTNQEYYLTFNAG